MYVICENLLNVTRKCECEGFIKFRSLTYPPILISLKSFSGATRRRLQLGPRAPGNQSREVSRPLELRGGQLSFLQQIERIISRSHTVGVCRISRVKGEREIGSVDRKIVS